MQHPHPQAQAGTRTALPKNSCVAIMKRGLAKCASSDWDCKCSGAANIANCYVDCSDDDPDSSAAKQLSVNDCATANAYDQGETTVAPSWTLPGSNAAQPTDTDASVTISGSSSTTAGPTKAFNGNEKSTSPSEGAAVVNDAGSWLALVVLGIGAAF
ncbi:hypothetical protein LT330_010229 [Penicillium expansum]|uniref:Uncharacterized protein n=1 Tax=Penicillium expansum TaxID=27334 RepID=A0A0A2JPU7_PENEN|nr:hypothetical protein PEX2_076940 [Penicillium expansum]KAK4864019.1 hypothetical protein LT330_010229 [Penicillium expansum]KGO39507.1 hypothetical protein PEXP_049220 [Penicillium expansum]KGO56866.1 hypothetical protein PEX2_076940 [Penicillium expansum]KGO71013.1 hypothetical protein PEX1_071750 [Penicillium expansum]